MAAARRHWPPTLAEMRAIVADEPIRHQSRLPVWSPGCLPQYLERARNPVQLRREIEAEAAAARSMARRELGFTLVEMLVVVCVGAAVLAWVLR